MGAVEGSDRGGDRRVVGWLEKEVDYGVVIRAVMGLMNGGSDGVLLADGLQQEQFVWKSRVVIGDHGCIEY